MTCSSTEETKESFIINIPLKGEFLVEEGKIVKENQILFLGELQGDIKEFNLASDLSINPKTIKKILLCSIGSSISKDQMLIEKKSFFSKSKIFRSPMDGVIEYISEEGIIGVRGQGQNVEIKSPCSGKIAISNGCIKLEIKGIKFEGLKGSGEKKWGKIRIIKDSNQQADLANINIDDKEKIIIYKGKITDGIYHKAEALNLAGLVGGVIPLQMDFGDVSILELGEKDEVISDKIWEALKKTDGDNALIFGREKYLFIPKE